MVMKDKNAPPPADSRVKVSVQSSPRLVHPVSCCHSFAPCLLVRTFFGGTLRRCVALTAAHALAGRLRHAVSGLKPQHALKSQADRRALITRTEKGYDVTDVFSCLHSALWSPAHRGQRLPDWSSALPLRHPLRGSLPVRRRLPAAPRAHRQVSRQRQVGPA